ncbi:MAG: hypothetical protein U1E76_02225 [Planctomycetota bacterium]
MRSSFDGSGVLSASELVLREGGQDQAVGSLRRKKLASASSDPSLDAASATTPDASKPEAGSNRVTDFRITSKVSPASVKSSRPSTVPLVREPALEQREDDHVPQLAEMMARWTAWSIERTARARSAWLRRASRRIFLSRGGLKCDPRASAAADHRRVVLVEQVLEQGGFLGLWHRRSSSSHTMHYSNDGHAPAAVPKHITSYNPR